MRELPSVPQRKVEGGPYESHRAEEENRVEGGTGHPEQRSVRRVERPQRPLSGKGDLAPEETVPLGGEYDTEGDREDDRDGDDGP
jgi:hypothetical protein